MKVNIDTSDMLYAEAWNGFKGTDWKEEINVRDFIQHNYTPYEGMNLSSPKQRLRPLHCGKKLWRASVLKTRRTRRLISILILLPR